MPWRVRYTRRRGSIAIKVTDSEIRLLAPQGTAQKTLVELLHKRADWIEQTLARRQHQAPTLPNYQSGEALALEGRHYPLQVSHGTSAALRLHPTGFELTLPGDCHDRESRRDLIRSWYQQEAQARWPARVDAWAQHTGLRPSSLKIRPYKSRWGSCTRQGRVSLNTLLLGAPEAVLDYVIVHELCHLVHLNHSPAFWELVSTYCPDWKRHRRWLREEGHRLELR
nr:SprT family zinc-dependent metalloprotease [Motiliproteus sp. SC1-56]